MPITVLVKYFVTPFVEVVPDGPLPFGFVIFLNLVFAAGLTYSFLPLGFTETLFYYIYKVIFFILHA